MQADIFGSGISIDAVTPLAYAIGVQDFSLAQICLEFGADPNKVIADTGLTPLQLAFTSDQMELVKHLLGTYIL